MTISSMKYSWIAATAVVLSGASAQGQQKVDVRHAASPDISVRIAGPFGKLRIVGWSKDSVAVTGSLPKAVRFEASFGGTPGSASRGAKMFVEAPNDLATAGTGSLELHVPVRARVWAKSGSAEIAADGILGGLDLNIVGGRVHVAGNPRELNVESMDGAIVVDGSPEWVRLKSAAGDITMTGGSTDAAFTSVSGTIHVSDGAFDRTRVETVTGGITFEGDLARGASCTIDTHSGSIDVRLGPAAGVEVDAVSLAGAIDSRLRDRRPREGREGRGQELTTSLGSGTARLTIRAYRSTITIGYR